MKIKSIKVILDTNVWISFLIGKRLSIVKNYITDGTIEVIITQQLLLEIKEVTGREKLKKYFPEQHVTALLELLKAIGTMVEIHSIHLISRDAKDNFLLDLIDCSKADYLITGDKDLLGHHPFMTASILSPADFEKMLLQL